MTGFRNNKNISLKQMELFRMLIERAMTLTRSTSQRGVPRSCKKKTSSQSKRELGTEDETSVAFERVLK